ncbi:MAG: radical SAM family heme chaperone HemW [Nitrospiria bacterium]
MNHQKKDHYFMGLYLNFPFCPVKCHFCSFGSRLFHLPTVNRYFEAIQRELIHYSGILAYRERVVNTVYIGGGTPTLVSEGLPQLLKSVQNCFELDSAAEITVEAHPAGISSERLSGLVQGGFNRISFGVQSFRDSDLTLMNRGHSVQEVYEAYDYARGAGFKNINLDLIYGLPGQTLSQWEENLHSAINLSPEHLSVYGLTLEEKTYFYHLNQQGAFEEAEDEIQAEMYRMTLQMLKQAGFNQYEVSNFARAGFESRHNLHYWTQGNFLGLGASACSYFEGVHTSNISSVEGYLRKVAETGTTVEQTEVLDLGTRFKEALIFGLRKNAGIRLSSFDSGYQSFVEGYLPKLTGLSRQGFLKNVNDDSFSLTEKGLFYYDHISMTLC